MKLIQVLSVAAALLVSAASADVIVTKGGSTINGKILGVDGGKIKVATDFAGEITIDQSKVASLTTDEPIYLTLEDGTTHLGPVSSTETSLSVASSTGQANTTIDSVTEVWMPGEKSPTTLRNEAALADLKRKWAYEATFDLTGKTGNSESNGLGTSFRATLQGPDDRLQFFARANYEETDDAKSADDARGGVDYTNRIGTKYNWYVRTELGYDDIKDIEQMYTVAAGFGYIFSETEKRNLGVRGGFGYLYESYDGDRDATSSASMDLGLNHKETLKWGTWINRATFTPTIEDFGNFRFDLDSSVDLPLKAEGWSIRSGVNFAYDSEADVSDKEELDTTYYIRMLLKWK
ncbi:DUF481 domain-containing protein [Pelagicoccus mobilis]|uniref:DUF481 domain-containing protein n=1 Tax=Pelagicoccus mobilis TaxID=415221 RepID=A0A934S256_9BACT|nr:DUF481 domain-containing protein [Pelagicoccus mobilis]MBK1880498.1 DUF481 domain-containing protein [Pelagicoccus mobilis]